ncbi:MAG: 2-amino-4-hydroxy-6-hydroxymethyldihydropteridine diphosphokinase [Candidatus Zixiibacteriota bacterium]|nr:MAG: 2-amino-4-hydroxy-6-hydroxymethyldihydropteridine diphosphokinase [candidate division Zixibacteria bacterium]
MIMAKKEKQMPHTIFLGLGSNLGDRENYLISACRAITDMEGFETIACSPVYISRAVEMDDSAPSFLNMVIKGQFQYTPLELLTSVEKIEKQLGRKDKSDHQPRTIDIDILLFGNEAFELKRLVVPHKKMTRRPFVLVPLLHIEPDLVHPLTKRPLSTYLKKKDRESLILYKEIGFNHVHS